MTYETFDRWITAYGCASTENDSQASANLCTLDALYYENPFDEPSNLPRMVAHPRNTSTVRIILRRCTMNLAEQIEKLE